jgi:hypothetical protein
MRRRRIGPRASVLATPKRRGRIHSNGASSYGIERPAMRSESL